MVSFSCILSSKPKSIVCRFWIDCTLKVQPVLPHVESGIPHVCIFSLWSKLADILGNQGIDKQYRTQTLFVHLFPSFCESGKGQGAPQLGDHVTQIPEQQSSSLLLDHLSVCSCNICWGTSSRLLSEIIIPVYKWHILPLTCGTLLMHCSNSQIVNLKGTFHKCKIVTLPPVPSLWGRLFPPYI